MPRPKGLMQQPKRWEIESRFGMDLRGVVYSLYQRNDNLLAIANEIGVTRATLYTWIGKDELSLLKAQARYRAKAEWLEIKESVLN